MKQRWSNEQKRKASKSAFRLILHRYDMSVRSRSSKYSPKPWLEQLCPILPVVSHYCRAYNMQHINVQALESGRLPYCQIESHHVISPIPNLLSFNRRQDLTFNLNPSSSIKSIPHRHTAIEPAKMAAGVSSFLKPLTQSSIKSPNPLTPIPALRRPQARLDQNLHLPRPKRPNSNRPPSLQKAQRRCASKSQSPLATGPNRRLRTLP